MKKKTLLNALVVVGIVAILYFFVGHNFTIFYLSGKSELLAAATQINERCNIEGSCPTDLEGWTAQRFRADMLSTGNMHYIVSADDKGNKNQEFRLIYQFFMPDSWFEAQGGVGQMVTSGWRER